MSNDILRRATSTLADRGIDGLIVSSPDNVAYTAGFEVPSQVIPVSRHRLVFCVLTANGSHVIIVPDMEASLARSDSVIRDVREYNEFTDSPIEFLADVLRELGLTGEHIAVEDDFIPGAYLSQLYAALPETKFTPARQLMSDLRAIKTPAELEKLRAIGRIAELAHCEATAKAREGMTELQLANLIYESLFSHGTEKVNHLVIGSGPRSEHGNANPTTRRLERGDLIRLDIFAKIGGYQSDVARTAVVGKPNQRQQEIWNSLISARQLILDMIRPGASTGAIYSAYATYFEEQGLKPINFVGHGLGITLHEEPYISRYHDDVLRPGMVLAIEPLYLIQGEGYQVEDEIIITENGYELITNYQDPPELLTVPTS